MAEFEDKCKELKGQISALNDELADMRKPTNNETLMNAKPDSMSDVSKAPKMVGAGVLSFTEKAGKVSSLAWLDDEHVATILQDGKIVVHNAKHPKNFTMCWYRSQPVFLQTSGFSPDGTKLAVAGLDNVLTVHNIDMTKDQFDTDGNIKPFKVCEKHGGYISDMKWIDNSNCLTSSGDKSILRWDLTKPNLTLKEPVGEFKGHNKDVCGIDVVDDNLFISASSDSYAMLWDARVPAGNGCVTTFSAGSAINCMKKLNGVGVFAVGVGDAAAGDADDIPSAVKLFDIRSQQMMNEYAMPSDKDPVQKIEVSKSNRLLYTGHLNGTVRAMDLVTGKEVWSDASLKGEVSALTLSRDGSGLAAGARAMNAKNFSLFI